MLRKLVVLLALTLVVSCGEQDKSSSVAKPDIVPVQEIGGIKTGPWRVVLEHPGGGLPFTLEIAEGPKALFLNGKERMPAEEVDIVDGKLDIRFPSYESALTATLQDDGTLAGTVSLTRRLGTLKTVEFPLVATHGQTWRHFETQDPNPASVAGTWDVALNNPFGGPARKGLGIFEQDGAIVTGTMLFSQGDYRWLQGEVKDGELYLSTFDGGQGTVWRATIQPDGSLKGLFHAKSYGFPPVPWSAVADENATLPDANSFTKMREGAGPLAFSFPNLDGDMVSLSDPRYKNKVVLITIGGTWCPTCHDEAAFLSPFYEENKDRGLEVIALQFEYTSDLKRNTRQISSFKKRYDITYETLIAGAFGKDNVTKALPMLDKFEAYPTTIFVDRSGEVRRIHTSFPGKATGKRYELHTAEFRAFLNELLNEETS